MKAVVPEYDVRAKALLDVVKDLSHTYRLRFGIEMIKPTTFKERPITLTLKNVTLRDLVDRMVQAAGFSEASWSIAGDEVGVISPDSSLVFGYGSWMAWAGVEIT